MKRKNKSLSFALIVLLASALSTKQTHAMDQVAIVATNAIGFIGAGVSWHVIAGQLFTGQTPAAAAAAIDPTYFNTDQGDMTKLFGPSYHKELLVTEKKIDLFDGRTLQLALQSDNIEPLQALLDAGANPNIVDKWGCSALWWAVTYQKIQVVKLLLEAGADINLADKHGMTALMNVKGMRHAIEIAKLLLSRKANVNIANKKGETALMFTASHAHEVPVIKLLLDAGANINDIDKRGCTALMRAAQNGCYEIVQLLLSRGADANLVDKNGQKALDHATWTNSEPYDRTAKILKKANAR